MDGEFRCSASAVSITKLSAVRNNTGSNVGWAESAHSDGGAALTVRSPGVG